MSGLPERAPRSLSIGPLGPLLRGADIVRVILLGLALFGLAVVVLRWIVADGARISDAPGTAARVNYLIAYFAAWAFAWLGAIWLVFVRGRGLTFAALGYVAPERMWAARAVLFAFAVLPLVYVSLVLLRAMLGSKSDARLEQFIASDLTVAHAAVLLLYGGFLAPLAEEFVFRGLLFRWLRQRFAFWPAALISAALFGFAHINIDQIAIAALLGLPLAWLYERSRSLAAAILMHQTYNSLVLMIAFAAVWVPAGSEG
jgi:membrane protease YdiL (CAAX protease family)